MGTRFHVGAKELVSAISAYAKRFDFLEVPISTQPLPPGSSEGTTPRTAPSIATLRKWRREVPPHFTFSVVAPPALSRLKPGDALEREVVAARAAIDALQARLFLLRTPPEVTPGQVWRDRMQKLLERFPRDATHVAWEPSGVWELDEAALTAKRWGVVLVVDAARDPVPPGTVAYVRLPALGETRSYGTAALERVLTAVGARRDAYVVFETDSALAEAKRLRSIAQRAKKEGGFGRLIRPRGGLLVRDDEQE